MDRAGEIGLYTTRGDDALVYLGDTPLPGEGETMEELVLFLDVSDRSLNGGLSHGEPPAGWNGVTIAPGLIDPRGAVMLVIESEGSAGRGGNAEDPDPSGGVDGGWATAPIGAGETSAAGPGGDDDIGRSSAGDERDEVDDLTDEDGAPGER